MFQCLSGIWEVYSVSVFKRLYIQYITFECIHYKYTCFYLNNIVLGAPLKASSFCANLDSDHPDSGRSTIYACSFCVRESGFRDLPTMTQHNPWSVIILLWRWITTNSPGITGPQRNNVNIKTPCLFIAATYSHVISCELSKIPQNNEYLLPYSNREWGKSIILCWICGLY